MRSRHLCSNGFCSTLYASMPSFLWGSTDILSLHRFNQTYYTIPKKWMVDRACFLLSSDDLTLCASECCDIFWIQKMMVYFLLELHCYGNCMTLLMPCYSCTVCQVMRRAKQSKQISDNISNCDKCVYTITIRSYHRIIQYNHTTYKNLNVILIVVD